MDYLDTIKAFSQDLDTDIAMLINKGYKHLSHAERMGLLAGVDLYIKLCEYKREKKAYVAHDRHERHDHDEAVETRARR